jgi:hypothetical protein
MSLISWWMASASGVAVSRFDDPRRQGIRLLKNEGAGDPAGCAFTYFTL